MDYTSYVAKTKTLISCVITAQLLCVFVFAYVKSRFSHDTYVHSRKFQANQCLKVLTLYSINDDKY